MAPGVGKTYRALQDLRRARDAGRDVAVAIVETHGRAETALQVEGLEVLPRRTIEHRGIVQHELDLPALLVRAARGRVGPAGSPGGAAGPGGGTASRGTSDAADPAGDRLLVLVDELAHTNAPGVEHAKRWQDVDVALAAGIDVVSTVNVQHLESLNDQVMELTGVRVRETVPDRVLVDAEDVVVIDLPPEALLQRLRDGQIYPVERVPAALNNFFRVERLTALRETALLQVAEEVGARRLSARPARVRDDGRGPVGTREPADQPRLGDDVVDAVRERVLVLVSANGSGQRVLRRAWRSARRLRAHVDVLHVQRPGREPSAVARERLAGLQSLCGLLGVELLTLEDDEVDVAAARVARERGTTYVFVGVPRPPTGLRRATAWLPPALTGARDPLPVLLWRRLPGVDVRIVSDRSDRPDR
jgi:two-component system sensor histidine kinase KdpD